MRAGCRCAGAPPGPRCGQSNVLPLRVGRSRRVRRASAAEVMSDRDPPGNPRSMGGGGAAMGGGSAAVSGRPFGRGRASARSARGRPRGVPVRSMAPAEPPCPRRRSCAARPSRPSSPVRCRRPTAATSRRRCCSGSAARACRWHSGCRWPRMRVGMRVARFCAVCGDRQTASESAATAQRGESRSVPGGGRSALRGAISPMNRRPLGRRRHPRQDRVSGRSSRRRSPRTRRPGRASALSTAPSAARARRGA